MQKWSLIQAIIKAFLSMTEILCGKYLSDRRDNEVITITVEGPDGEIIARAEARRTAARRGAGDALRGMAVFLILAIPICEIALPIVMNWISTMP